MWPSSTSTACSLIQPPFTLRSVLLARVMPSLMASSKLFSERELISVTRATDMSSPPVEIRGTSTTLRRAHLDDPSTASLARDDRIERFVEAVERHLGHAFTQ